MNTFVLVLILCYYQECSITSIPNYGSYLDCEKSGKEYLLKKNDIELSYRYLKVRFICIEGPK